MQTAAGDIPTRAPCTPVSPVRAARREIGSAARQEWGGRCPATMATTGPPVTAIPPLKRRRPCAASGLLALAA